MGEALKRLEEMQQLPGKVASYAFRDFSTDVADPLRGALLQEVQESMTQTGTRLLFFNLEWLAVPDDAAGVLVASPELTNYRPPPEAPRRYRPYVLSEGEERGPTQKAVPARSS